MMNASMATPENNVAKKDKQQQVIAMKAKRLSFKKRKACIKKKTMELSVLCDVEACAVIVDANGQVETWPENQNAVLNIISRYKDCLRAGDKKKVVKNEHARDEKHLLNDYQLEWDDTLFDELSNESLEDLLKDCACDSDQNQNKVLNLRSWDDHLLDGLPIESLQELLREVDSKLEAVVERIEVLKMVDDQNNSNRKEIVVFNEEALKQNIWTPHNFSGPMCLFEGESSQQIIQAPNFDWIHDGSTFCFNNILGSSALDLAGNYNQTAQSFGGAPEQGFFNMMSGEQTIQTPFFFGNEPDQSLFDMKPGMCPPHQVSTSGLSFFAETEFPQQSIFGIGQNWTGYL